jgi:hypothetical protein
MLSLQLSVTPEISMASGHAMDMTHLKLLSPLLKLLYTSLIPKFQYFVPIPTRHLPLFTHSPLPTRSTSSHLEPNIPWSIYQT